MLIMWSLAAAYLILFAGVPYAMRRVKGFGSNVQEALNTEPQYAEPIAHMAPEPFVQAVSVAAPAPVMPPALAAEIPTHMPNIDMNVAPTAPHPATLAREGFKSFATGEALTIDDIVKGLSRESGMVFTQHTHLEQEPEASYATDMTPRAKATTIEEAPAAPAVAAPQETVATPTYSDDISGFIGALLSGNRDAVFGTLRDVNRTGGDTQEFLTHAVCALDDAYRARLDGTACHPEIARLTSDCATSFLERLVTSLATAIDSSYSAGITGAKLAVTRALAIVNG